LRRRGANTILPGLIATDRNADLEQDTAGYAQLLQRIPARRAGTAAEVATLALYLASAMGAYVTGADILVDGGLALP